MLLELLTQAGLTPTQAEILGFLYSVNDLKVIEIAKALDKPRGVVYKALEELCELSLIQKIDKYGGVTRFKAEHPSKIESLYIEKEKNTKLEREKFLRALPEISSDYNLKNLKPATSFFEGEAGLRDFLNENQKLETEQLIFLDARNVVDEKFAEIIQNYSQFLNSRSIKQRMIVVNGKSVMVNNQNLEIRYLNSGLTIFKTSVKIYDNKIAYQTVDNERIITVLINDRNIYEMNCGWFEMLWQTLS
ncbi:MAG: helix-turn-helix domain-containing protein [bacterium]